MAQITKRGYTHGGPFDSGFLSVDAIHKVHYEQYGNKDGKPVVFLHGGPGGSTSPKNAVYFNPAVYRVILFDQRGCGQSLPSGEIRENTPLHSVSDIEVLRKHVGIQQWHVFGASWGSTLSLLYAQTHPEAVASLTLRGISFEAQEEIDFNASFQRTRNFRPELYEELTGHLTEGERKDVAGSYAKRFSCGDYAVELAAMKVYDRWAGGMSKPIPKEDHGDATMTAAEEEQMYLEPAKVEKIKDIPCAIVNGRYDLLCPPTAAWRLHKILPKSKLFIIPDAGHSAAEPGTHNKLVDICDEFATLPV